jgi:hypothetical protein
LERSLPDPHADAQPELRRRASDSHVGRPPSRGACRRVSAISILNGTPAVIPLFTGRRVSACTLSSAKSDAPRGVPFCQAFAMRGTARAFAAAAWWRTTRNATSPHGTAPGQNSPEREWQVALAPHGMTTCSHFLRQGVEPLGIRDPTTEHVIQNRIGDAGLEAKSVVRANLILNLEAEAVAVEPQPGHAEAVNPRHLERRSRSHAALG